MFRNLNYKQKLRLTGIAGLLALFLCYRWSISRTLEEYQKYSRETEMVNGRAGGSSLQEIDLKEARINGLMAHFALDTLLPEKNLLSVVSNYCKQYHLQLKEYRPFHVSREDSLPVLT